jgi:uncharacterized protein (TIGR02452 family)
MNIQSLDKNSYMQNLLIAPIIQFHGKVISTFDELPQNGKVWEVAIRIVTLAISPLAYLALGISALIGLAYHSLKDMNISGLIPSQPTIIKNSLATRLCTVPQAFGAMASEWSLKEIVGLLSISRESLFVREYLNTITPQKVAEKEEINLDALIETFRGKDIDSVHLSFEGRDLISALELAIKAAKENPSQGFKQIWSALLAMKILQESIAAHMLTVKHPKDKEGAEGRVIWGFSSYAYMDLPEVCDIVELLYRFAREGKVDGEIVLDDEMGQKYSKKLISIIEALSTHPRGFKSILKCMEKDNKLPENEKKILCKTFREVIKFVPYLLKENASFQQLQDEKLQKWNKEFKSIVNGEAQFVAQKLRPHRIPLYETTKDACLRGFFVNNKLTKLSERLKEEMIQNTELCSPDKLPALTNNSFVTRFEVVDEDTINLAKRYEVGGLNPVALNLANAFKPGGGVETGEGPQEESLFRRSNYHQALYPRKKSTKEAFYPIPQTSVIYTPKVQIFRTGEPDYTKPLNESDLGYEFHHPYPISFIAAAHIELKRSSKINEVKKLDRKLAEENSLENRANLEKICDKIVKELGIEEAYEQVSKAKMRSILRTAAIKKYNALVLGALGCGAFANPGYLNAIYWKEVFSEPEFQGRFKKVGFAIRSFGTFDLINSFKSLESLNKPLDLEGTD